MIDIKYKNIIKKKKKKKKKKFIIIYYYYSYSVTNVYFKLIKLIY